MSISPFVDQIYKPYPVLVLDALKPAIEALPQCNICETRLLNPVDSNGSVGVIMAEWVPGEPTIGHFEPESGEYMIQIQTLVKNTNAAEGEIQHYVLGDALKRLLYRDTALNAALRTLSVDDDQHEHTSRWGLIGQRFANNKIGQEFVFTSTTTLFFTTEIAC